MISRAQQVLSLLGELNDDIVKIVNLKLTQLEVPYTIRLTRATNDKMTEIGAFTIAPSSLPKIFAPVFNKIDVTVEAGTEGNDAAAIYLFYRWEHPWGKNGFYIYWRYARGKWKVSYT